MTKAGETVKKWILAAVKWLADFFDAASLSSSMKRLTVFMAAFTLCRGVIILCKAIAHQIYQNKPVDPNAAYVLGVLAIPVAALGGVAYIFRKDGASQATPEGATPAPIPTPEKP